MSLLLLLSLASLTVTDSDGALAEAGDALARGNYAEAAAIYDTLAASHPDCPALYLNQGNAHLLARQIGPAVFAYRRAERHWPNDPRVRANLAEALGYVVDPPTDQTPWLSALPSLPRKQRQGITLGCYLLGWALLALYLRQRKLWQLAVTILLLLAATLGLGHLYWSDADAGRHPLVVVKADEVVLRQGNGMSYPPTLGIRGRIVLHAGVEARYFTERPNQWVQIQLLDGTLGWVPTESVLIDR